MDYAAIRYLPNPLLSAAALRVSFIQDNCELSQDIGMD
jgi:hypothetical protein